MEEVDLASQNLNVIDLQFLPDNINERDLLKSIWCSQFGSSLTSETPPMASPTPSSDTLTTASNSSDSEGESSLNTKCSLCTETYTIPKVLSCFHTFCQPCLEKVQTCPDKVTCPDCHEVTFLPGQGLTGLMTDYAVSNVLETVAYSTSALFCTGCKSKDTSAVARCFDCAHFLCSNCFMAHQFMHCFEGHRVVPINELQQTNKDNCTAEKPVSCPRHRSDLLHYFCKTCSIPICKQCTFAEHSQGHDYDLIVDIGTKQMETMRLLIEEGKYRAKELRGAVKGIEHASNRVQVQYHKAQNDINDTFNFYRTVLEERKQDTLRELDEVFQGKKTGLGTLVDKLHDNMDRIYGGCDFIDKLIKHASCTEILLFKNFIDTCFQEQLHTMPDMNNLLNSSFDIEFMSNFQAIQAGVKNTFGYIRQGNEILGSVVKPQPIARPNGVNGCNTIVSTNNLSNGNIFETTNLTKFIPPSNNFMMPPESPPYEKWSNGTDIFQNGIDVFSTSSDPIMDITSKLNSTSVFPPKSQLKRQKMIYHCKFGEYGSHEGQFLEPSGVAVNAQNDIIVADTNNHRIQIFDKEGRFKFQFGQYGRQDGQLMYPNRVAVVKPSGDIIVTERSPTHQIQIYNQYGQFVRKFGANILQHPRGVTVDNKGRIVIVECKVMRVIIFDQFGNVLNKFGCSKYLEFPNGVIVNDKEEIFISDNRAHCVKVFNYQGMFLRQIGGEGITNYPIGVGINLAGEILVADNHNNFNLTVFTQDGQLVSALESKVKHAQCFDVALLDDGSVALASKDFRLYVYRYSQLPSLPL